MALTFDPFREMDRMMAQLVSQSADSSRTGRWMPMDLYRVDDHYVVNVDLPGVDPGSIDLDVDANTLTIQAERTLGAEQGAQWLARERSAGRFIRQLNLGDGLDVDGIDAHYDNGVLSLRIPVAEKARPRKISVSGPRSEITGEASEAISTGGSTESSSASDQRAVSGSAS